MALAVRKKLLILVDWFLPGYKAGGPIQSCVNLCRVLNDCYDIYVLTTDTDHGETQPYPGIVADKWLHHDELGVNVYYACKKKLSARQLAAQISSVNADTVYLNHLFSPYFVLYPLWLKLRGWINCKVVVCPRGALYESALSLKSYKKKPLLALYKLLGVQNKIIFHATNVREQAAIEHYFPGSTIVVADNLPVAKQAPFETIQKETGKLSCIYIARILPIKNLLFLLERLRNIQQQVELTIAGPVENQQYWNECKKVMETLPTNITVHYTGAKKNDEIIGLIQQHHLFVLATTGENFGHSIFEALLAGRPVLISDQTPWVNLKAKQAGWDISLNEPGKFETMITAAANFNQQQFDQLAKGAWDYANHFIERSVSKQQYQTLFS